MVVVVESCFGEGVRLGVGEHSECCARFQAERADGGDCCGDLADLAIVW